MMAISNTTLEQLLRELQAEIPPPSWKGIYGARQTGRSTAIHAAYTVGVEDDLEPIVITPTIERVRHLHRHFKGFNIRDMSTAATVKHGGHMRGRRPGLVLIDDWSDFDGRDRVMLHDEIGIMQPIIVMAAITHPYVLTPIMTDVKPIIRTHQEPHVHEKGDKYVCSEERGCPPLERIDVTLFPKSAEIPITTINPFEMRET
jgi:hypothetical protein